jgi:hypothetical protein
MTTALVEVMSSIAVIDSDKMLRQAPKFALRKLRCSD